MALYAACFYDSSWCSSPVSTQVGTVFLYALQLARFMQAAAPESAHVPSHLPARPASPPSPFSASSLLAAQQEPSPSPASPASPAPPTTPAGATAAEAPEPLEPPPTPMYPVEEFFPEVLTGSPAALEFDGGGSGPAGVQQQASPRATHESFSGTASASGPAAPPTPLAAMPEVQPAAAFVHGAEQAGQPGLVPPGGQGSGLPQEVSNASTAAASTTAQPGSPVSRKKVS